jgi:hypothetical protein
VHGPTTYFLATVRVDDSDFLIGHHLQWRFQQATVGIHSRREPLCLHAFPFGRLGPNNDSYLKQNPLTPTSIACIRLIHRRRVALQRRR